MTQPPIAFATTFPRSASVAKLPWRRPGPRDWANGAKARRTYRTRASPASPPSARPGLDARSCTGSPAHGVTRPPGDEVETCGVCHSRRGQFAEGWQPGQPLADFYRPVFLTPDLFEDDGQMRDEVFNYASFQQSKMYAKGVVCSDCHDPHSGKLKAEGSEVCSQCHMPQGSRREPYRPSRRAGRRTASPATCRRAPTWSSTVATTTASGSPGRTCRTRSDAQHLHDCHADKPAAWAAAAIERWHGPDTQGLPDLRRGVPHG